MDDLLVEGLWVEFADPMVRCKSHFQLTVLVFNHNREDLFGLTSSMFPKV